MCSLPNRSPCSDGAVLARAVGPKICLLLAGLSRKRVGRAESMKGVIGVLFLFLSEAVMLGAQTFRGAINGTVMDPSGAVVANAQVQTTEITTSVNHNTVTTADGQFSIQDLPLGAYRITVAAPGFATYIANDASVTAVSSTLLQLNYRLGRRAVSLRYGPLRSRSIALRRLRRTPSRKKPCRTSR
jgi:hypothetical protein